MSFERDGLQPLRQSQPRYPIHVPTEDLIAIAHILRPQGRRGEVLADLLTDRMEEFRAGRVFALAKSPSAPAKAHTLEDHWLPIGKNVGRIVLKLSGSNSISEAETLAGLDVLIPISALPTLEEDTFYIRDLVGCTLLNGATQVGEIIDVQFATSPDGRVRLEDAAPLLEVQTSAREEPTLVPFVKIYLDHVDISAKQVVMNLPEGLLEPSSER